MVEWKQLLHELSDMYVLAGLFALEFECLQHHFS